MAWVVLFCGRHSSGNAKVGLGDAFLPAINPCGSGNKDGSIHFISLSLNKNK
jgi:hypothetical protein